MRLCSKSHQGQGKSIPVPGPAEKRLFGQEVIRFIYLILFFNLTEVLEIEPMT